MIRLVLSDDGFSIESAMLNADNDTADTETRSNNPANTARTDSNSLENFYKNTLPDAEIIPVCERKGLRLYEVIARVLSRKSTVYQGLDKVFQASFMRELM